MDHRRGGPTIDSTDVESGMWTSQVLDGGADGREFIP